MTKATLIIEDSKNKNTKYLLLKLHDGYDLGHDLKKQLKSFIKKGTGLDAGILVKELTAGNGTNDLELIKKGSQKTIDKAVDRLEFIEHSFTLELLSKKKAKIYEANIYGDETVMNI